MNTIFKKIVAALMSIVMLVTLMSTAVFATESSIAVSYPTLILNEEQTVEISEGGEMKYISFVPEETNTYIFESFADGEDTCGYLFNSEMGELAYNDDFNGRNFSIQYELIAGEQYYFAARYYSDNTGSFPVMLSEKAAIIGIEFPDIELIENTNGYMENASNEERYYYYNTWTNAIPYVNILLSNGTTKKCTIYNNGTFYFYYDGEQYYPETEATQNEDYRWTLGNTYTATISVMGYVDEIDITIVESPIKNIDFEPITIYEGVTPGYECENWDDNAGPYFNYYWSQKLSFDVTLKGDEVLTDLNENFNMGNNGSYEYFYIDGNRYTLTCNDKQHLEHWTADNDYTVQVEILNKTYDIPVYVRENPIEKIEFEPISIENKTNGYWTSDYNEETDESSDSYYRYEYTDNLNYNIIMKNGDEVTGSSIGEENPTLKFDGESCQISFEDTQSATTPWNVGNTYTVNVFAWNINSQLNITISELPATSITLDEEQMVDITESYDIKYFAFTPEQSGTYRFESLAEDADTYGYLYDYDMNELASEDYGGDNGNFRIDYDLEAEKKYYFAAKYYGDATGSFPVKLSRSPYITNLEFQDVQIYENSNGDIKEASNGEKYYYYSDWASNLKVTMSNGDVHDVTFDTTLENLYYEFDGKQYYPEISVVQDENNRWTAGNTYNVAFTLGGVTSTINITILESPIDHIEFEPMNFAEGTHGEYYNYWDEENQTYHNYYEYTWWDYINGTVYFKNGSTDELNDDSGLDFEGDWYNWTHIDDQDYFNQWEVGGPYTGTLSVLGYTVDLSINILESPIENIEFNPITIYEGISDGETSYYWDEQTEQRVEYFKYKWINKLSYTVTMQGEDVVNAQGSEFYHNDDRYSLYCSDNQQNEHWEIGDNYTVTINFMGETYQVPVYVVENPIDRIEFKPISLNENSGGYWHRDYDEETGEESERYYRYNYLYHLDYDIILKNGETVSGTTKGLEEAFIQFEKEYFMLEREDNQSASSPWTAGDTYNAAVVVFGKSYPVEVTITERQATALVIDEEQTVEITTEDEIKYFSFVPETSGKYRFESFGDEDTRGYLYDLNMEELAENDDGYNGSNFCIDYELEADKKYYFAAKYYSSSKTGSFNVKLSIAPVITDIEFGVVELYENTEGYMMEASNGEEYYYYSDWAWNIPKITIEMSNGEMYGKHFDKENADLGFYFEGSWHYPEISVTQDENNRWTAGNTYTATISVLGFTKTVKIKILPSPIDRIEFKPIEMIENSDGYRWGENDAYYCYEWYNNSSYTVYLKNGRKIEGSGYGFEYEEDEWYYFDYNDYQSENPWTAGNTYNIDISIMGYSTQIPVTIIESPVDRIEISPISIIENTEGSVKDYWDDDDNHLKYYYYMWQNSVNATIHLKNGRKITVTRGNFKYNGKEYYVSSSNSQSSSNPWTAGNIYTVPVSMLGYDTTVDVTILESPVESVTVKPIAMTADKDGIWQDSYNPETGSYEEYYHYIWQDHLSYTIHFKDGSSINCTGTNFQYNGKTYEIISYSEQSADNIWQAGGTYTNTISIFGYETDVEVSILEQNVEDNIHYLVQGDCAIITGIEGVGELFEIPETIGEYPVIAITSLGDCEYEEIIIPDSVTSVSKEMLCRCINLKKITFGAGVSAITKDMFYGLPDLEEIVVSEDNKDYVSIDGIIYNADVTKMLAIPQAKTTTHVVPATVTDISLYMNGSYKFDIDLSQATGCDYVQRDSVIYSKDMSIVYSCSPNKTGSYDMPDQVTTISNLAFANSNLTEVEISNNVTEIAYYAFTGSVNLEKVVLPENLTSIGHSAFANCKNLTDVTLPSTLETMENQAFRNTGIKEIHIPGSLKEISYAAFENSALETLTIDEGVTTIVGYSFAGTKLKEIVLPDSLTLIGSSSFEESTLESVDLGSGLTHISKFAFAYTSLEELSVPANVEYIGIGAFRDTNIKNLELAEGITTIDEGAFARSLIETLDIPESVTDITYKCFEDSKPLLNIDLPDSLESLDGYAFHGTAWYASQPDGVVYLENALYHYKGNMPQDTEIVVENGTEIIADYAFGDYENLKSITLPKSIKTIGYRAFNGCSSLTDVYFIGSEEDKENIIIEEVNAPLENATWHYNCCDHDWKDATCTVPKTCKLCQETKGEKLGHSFTNYVSNGNATCKADGTKTAKCTRCTATNTLPDVGSKHNNHSYNAGTVTTRATCKANGVKTHTCTVCGGTKTTSIPKTTTHTYDTGAVTRKATCKVTGVKTFTCTVCSGTKTTSIPKTTTHTYSNACDTSCNTCGATRRITHDYENITTKATLSKNGKIVKKCSVCDDVASTAVIQKIKTVKLSATSYTYNGKVKTPSVVVKDSAGKTLKKNTDYTITYEKGRKNVGSYDVVVKFKGKYSGTKTFTFKINPATTSIKKLTAAKKSLKVSITKKSTQVTGYQIQYSTSKSFKSAKTTTVKSYKTTSATLKSLKAKKTYYVRIRTFKKDGKTTYYSSWSSAKSQKTK